MIRRPRSSPPSPTRRSPDLMFAGSLVNEPGEDARRFPTQKVRFRRDFLAALAEAQRESRAETAPSASRSEEHTSELQSPCNLVCRLLLEKKKLSLLDPALET